MKRYPKKLVVLDFDGVLTAAKPGGKSYWVEDPEGYGICDELFDRLVALCKETKAKVLISSNWRRFPDNGYYDFHGKGKKYTNHLPELKARLGKLYFDDLPHDRHLTKSEALELWFEFNEGFKGKFVIFDDDWREGFASSRYCNNYIETNDEFGLTDADVERAKKILTEE